MIECRYLVLGAGPSGLAFAHTLAAHGELSFLVLEREDVAGGLCRSVEVDGAPLDIGGGHFLDVRRPEVLELLFRFLPREEWVEYARISRVRLRGQEVDHPLEANLWQLPLDDQIEFLESIAQAGCVRGTSEPKAFADWIVWKLGARIADEYLLPYNRKIWSVDVNDLGTHWLHKLPSVSFRETLRSCLDRRPHGSIPAHAVFLYPRRFGYGEVWRRMGAALGERLLLETPVSSIDVATRTVNGRYRAAEVLVNTIPWTAWPGVASLPSEITAHVAHLRYAAIDVDYHMETPTTDAHWIYDPDETVAYHRMLCRANFCGGARGHWTETNAVRAGVEHGWRHRNEYAYPLATRTTPAAIGSLLAWAERQGIVGLGRWGTWEHMNSDVAVAQAIAAARRLLGHPVDRPS